MKKLEQPATFEQRVTIVIPTYGRPHDVARSIVSALAQGLDCLEILVVDDNDDHRLQVATQNAVLSLADARVKYLQNYRSKGGCGARNSGVLNASSNLIAFLDDDDVLLPGGLNAQMGTMQDSSDAALCFGAAQVVDEVFKRRFINRPSKTELTFSDIVQGMCPPTSSVVMARKEALLHAGLFDESLPSFQDFDMWLRVSRVGRIVSHPAIVAQFVQHGGARTSIDLDKRMLGLEKICKKWESDFVSQGDMEEFRARFASRAFFENGQRLLSSGLGNRLRALSLIFRAFQCARTQKPQYFTRFLIACLGYNSTRIVMRIRDTVA